MNCVYMCTPAPVLCSFLLEMLMCPVTRELLSGAAAVPPTPPPLFATTVNYTDLWCNTMSRERENGELDLPGHCNRSPSKARENIYTRTSKSSSLLCLMGEMWNVIYRNEVKEGAKAFIAFCYVDLNSPSCNPLFSFPSYSHLIRPATTNSSQYTPSSSSTALSRTSCSMSFFLCWGLLG